MVHRGKRARRDSSSSTPESIIAQSVSSPSDLLSVLSTSKPLASLTTNLASAPLTAPFPSTSAAFFPSDYQFTFVQHKSSVHSTPLVSPSNVNLNDLHREAFNRLRQSVAQSGEGFIRKMREWEQQRHTEPAESYMLGNDRERQKRRDRYRGRKGGIIRLQQRMIRKDPVPNHYDNSYQLSPHPHRQADDKEGAQYTPNFGGKEDETDNEDDIFLDDSTQMAFAGGRHRRGRSASFEDPMDVTDLPDIFDVEIADNDQESFPASTFHATFGFPFTYSNTRPSSPFSFVNTSDDECSYIVTNSGFNSPRGVHISTDRLKNSNSPQISQHARLMENVESVSITSSLSTSPTVMNIHLPLPSRASISQIIPATMERRKSNSSQTSSDKAVVALALALANDSGSLADYGDVREVQGDLQELEAGALWE